MITLRDLAAALHGLRLLLRFDTSCFDYFTLSTRGFWQSFIVAFFLAPLHLLHAAMDFGDRQTALAFAPYMLVNALSYAISWTAFPFAMLYITKLLDREALFFRHIVAYNWFQLPIGMIVFPLAILANTGALPVDAAAFLNMLTLGAFIAYAGFIAVNGLKISYLTAAGIVILDILISLLVNMSVARI